MRKTVSFVVVIALLAVGSFVAIRYYKAGRQMAAGSQSAQSTHGAHKAIYHCPMHPTYTSDKPGDCPICGMRLVLIKEDAAGTSAGTPAAGPADYAPVQISPEQQQAIGVATQKVAVRDLNKVIRTVGVIAYQPDLYSAQDEYIQSLTAMESAKNSPLPEIRDGARSTLESTRIRLRTLGMNDAQIRAIGARSKPDQSLLLPQVGGKAWVYASIYEYELGLVKVGQNVSVDLPAFPGEVFRGRIRAMEPVVDQMTRTVQARAQVDNPGGKLQPQMYVNAEISIPIGRRLAIPEDAVMDTGTRQMVFVKTGADRFEPRQVKLGAAADGYYEVLGGVSDDEEVVTAANFMIDSESRIRAAAGNK